MNFVRLMDRRLAAAAMLAALLAAAGAVLVIAARQGMASANQQFVAARSERVHSGEQLARIAQEERQVLERAETYRRLLELNIIGTERRLEWTESLARIRARLQLAEMRYQIAPRRLLRSLPGRPGNVESYASAMKIELGLLHEGDLIRFLEALRASGNAYYAVNRCAIERIAPAAGEMLAPRVRAVCEIDLVTLQDGGSRT